ncbi:MAG: putative acyltransferase [Phycisphaerales bacterium]|nr:putative acyltransferase [Phycisphaerales bacterium]
MTPMRKQFAAADSSRHIPSLDGLRGVAILLVMFRHFGVQGSGTSTGVQIIHRAASAGWMGVDLFFVLSGFLITRILWDAKGSNGFFSTFYARRALRIFPLYYGVLLVLYVGVPILTRETIPSRGAWWVWLYLSNIQGAMIGDFVRGTPHFDLGHLWSLAVEEQFYLVWPLAVFLLGRRGLLIACIVAIASAFVLRNGLLLAGFDYHAAYILTPCRMDGLAIGAGIALLLRTPEGIALCHRLTVLLFVPCGLGLLVLFASRRGLDVNGDRWVQVVGMSLTPVFFGSLIFLTILTPRGGLFERAFDRRWLRFFGRHAYGLYLFHPFLIRGAIRVARPFAASPLLTVLVIMLAGTGMSVGLAVLSFRFFENPINNLKRFFPYSRSTNNADAKAPELVSV